MTTITCEPVEARELVALESILEGDFDYTHLELADLVRLRHLALKLHRRAEAIAKPNLWRACIEIEDVLAIRSIA